MDDVTVGIDRFADKAAELGLRDVEDHLNEARAAMDRAIIVLDRAMGSGRIALENVVETHPTESRDV